MKLFRFLLCSLALTASVLGQSLGVYSSSPASTNWNWQASTNAALRQLGGQLYVDSIANLPALSGTSSPKTIQVNGFNASNDGGGGEFVFSAALPGWASATNAMCIAASGGGYWIRDIGNGQSVYQGNDFRWRNLKSPIKASWFGAVGDWNSTSSTGTDNVEELQEWINFIASGFVGELQGGTYGVSGTLTIPTNFRFATIEGNNSAIVLTANLGAGGTALLKTDKNQIAFSEIRNLSLNAQTNADHAVFFASEAGTLYTSQNTLTWRNVSFWWGNEITVRLGDYTTTTRDSDLGVWSFDRCVFTALNNKIGVQIDAPNAVPMNFSDCGWPEYGTNQPMHHIKALRGKKLDVRGGFFGQVQQAYPPQTMGSCVYVGANFGTVVVRDLHAETVRLLYVEAKNGAEQNIQLSGINTSEANLGAVPYMVYARGGTISMDSVYGQGGDNYSANVYVEDTLIANNVWLGASGEYILANRHRCSIDGIRLATARPVNGNPVFNWWTGAATKLPVGYSISPFGSTTIAQGHSGFGNNASSSYGFFSNPSVWIAEATTVTAAVGSGPGFMDGLMVTVPWTSAGARNQRLSLVAWGFATNLVNTTGIKVQAGYSVLGALSSSTFTNSVSTARLATANGNGFWWGTGETIDTSGQPFPMAFHGVVGLGTATATGINWIGGMFVLPMDGFGYDYNTAYPQYPLMKALTSKPWEAVLNPGFDDPDTTGPRTAWDQWTNSVSGDTTWSIVGGRATKIAGSGQALSQKLPEAIIGKRCLVMFNYTRTSGTGSLAATLGGQVLAAAITNQTDCRYTVLGSSVVTSLLTLTPTTDWEGSVDNVQVYVNVPAPQFPDEFTAAGETTIGAWQFPTQNAGADSAIEVQPLRMIRNAGAPGTYTGKIGDSVWDATGGQVWVNQNGTTTGWGQLLNQRVTDAQTIATSGTILANGTLVEVVGDGGAATGVKVTNGTFNGQFLVIRGQNSVNTVEIKFDEANMAIGGSSITLGDNDVLFLNWDVGSTKWQKISHSDN